MNRTNVGPSDGSEWELSKENVQPIKQGRKMHNLMAALGDEDHWKLQKDKKSFEAEIRTYEGDDPLDVWYRYVLWTEENVPKGGRDIDLLLERCIKEFKDVPKYRTDGRYLNVWLRYADGCSDPLEIFNYMYSQKICLKHSQFYMSWASACENVENFKKADEIIELGIARKAEPEDLLKKFQVGFQHRLTLHIANNDDSQIQEEQGNCRTALGLLKCDKKRNVGVSRALNVQAGQSGLKKTRATGSNRNTESSFAIHLDDDSENKMSRLLPGAVGDWKEPPTQSIVTKENELQPGKWTNDKASSSRRGHSSSVPLVRPVSKPSFQVHVEDNANQTCRVPQQSLENQVLTARKPEKDDPLKAISQVQNEGKEQANVRLMYDKAKVYTGTEEFQFEEIRGAKYALLRKQGFPLPREKRRRERLAQPVAEERDKPMYPKAEVYSLHGEFQLEEVMAQRYFARGRRLRPDKKPEAVKPVGVKVYAEPMETCANVRAKPTPFGERPITGLESQRSKRVAGPVSSLARNDKENCFSDNKGNENVMPNYVRNNERSATKEVELSKISEEPEHERIGEKRPKQRANFFKEKENGVMETRESAVSSALPLHYGDTKTPDTGSTPGENNESGYAKIFDVLHKDLAAPSPTITTKQVYADVLPWFNTTVGANDSDAEFEAQFKNDDGNDNDMFGMEFGGAPSSSLGKQRGDPEVYAFHDDNDENIPPPGYTQVENDRPLMGILQPSVNLPVEPLEDVIYKDDEEMESQPMPATTCTDDAPLKYEKLKDHEEDFTQFHGLNHTQFTQAARLASTPFGEKTDPCPLPMFHFSTIHALDDEVMKDPVVPDQAPSHVDQILANVTVAEMGTPNAILSPIMECSDEDGKTASGHSTTSGCSVSHLDQKASLVVGKTSTSAGTSYPGISGDHGLSSTINLETMKSERGVNHIGKSSTSAGIPHAGMNGDQGLSSTINLETTKLDRSLDITVHHANGDVLQMVNPFDPVVCQNLLSKLPTAVSSYHGYHDISYKVMPKVLPEKTIDLGGSSYDVEKKIGTGAFGKVFSAKSDNKKTVALKIQNPANIWEFYVCSELKKRLQTRAREEATIAVGIEEFYVFLDGSCCVSAYHEMGTFLDLVNQYKQNSRLAEDMACYYAIELMNILDCIHDCGIIHGDIKPDNLVLTKKPDSLPGLALIDFGCAIDCTLFPAGTRFSVEKNTESFECIEMKTGKPWTTQVDTYGMLGTLHCLLFGDYMKVYKDSKTLRWRPIKIVNRSWNKELWKTLFDVFLNIPSCDELPSLKSMLAEFRRYFDSKLKQRFLLHIEQTKYDEEVRNEQSLFQ